MTTEIPTRQELIEAVENDMLWDTLDSEEPDLALRMIKNFHEADIICQFFRHMGNGEYSAKWLTTLEIESYIWEHDMKKAYHLMQAWVSLRKSRLVRPNPIEGELGVLGHVKVDDPEISWHIHL